MNKTKSFLTSKGIWGSLIILVSVGVQSLANHFGFTVGEADIAEAMKLYTTGAEVFGGALALYGRVKATKRIK